MRKKIFVVSAAIIFILELVSLQIFYFNTNSYRMDAVEINRISHYLVDNYKNPTERFKYEYTVSLLDGTVYQTSTMAKNANEAVANGDIVIDLFDNGEFIGNIIVKNDMGNVYKKNMIVICVMAIVYALLDVIVAGGYYLYLKKRIIEPFDKIDFFARQIASGCLDIPLEMDKDNIFGAFTEAFDILRDELKIARENERQAQESKKELIAKLSHDIKTPVASIMATSELKSAINPDDNESKLIYSKAVQINELIINLFESSLEEVSHLNVVPTLIESKELYNIISASDYKKRINNLVIPECLINADSLRLCQVFDNVISNSYKYADSNIDVECFINDGYLVISFEDYGEKLSDDFIAIALEKYQRGPNSDGKTGAGLGLFLCNDFMNRMNGKFRVANGYHGFRAEVLIKLS